MNWKQIKIKFSLHEIARSKEKNWGSVPVIAISFKYMVHQFDSFVGLWFRALKLERGYNFWSKYPLIDIWSFQILHIHKYLCICVTFVFVSTFALLSCFVSLAPCAVTLCTVLIFLIVPESTEATDFLFSCAVLISFYWVSWSLSSDSSTGSSSLSSDASTGPSSLSLDSSSGTFLPLD